MTLVTTGGTLRVTPGETDISCPPTVTTTGSGLVGGAVKVAVSGSKVTLLPPPRLVEASVPSLAVKVVSTVPLITSTVTLPQVTTSCVLADISKSVGVVQLLLMFAGSAGSASFGLVS